MKRYDVGLLVMRLGLGLIMLYFGSQKMLGLFGGMGYVAQVKIFQEGGIPPLFGNLAIAGEFFGSLGVLFGLLTPVAAFGVASVMAVATYTNVRSPGIIESVFQKGDVAAATHLFFAPALFVLAVGIMIMGAGKYSLDAKLFGGKKAK